MNGDIDWAALPILFEILGIEDPEPVIRGLLTLRAQRR